MTRKKNLTSASIGVDFRVAARVFLDCDALLEFNSVDDLTGEERWNAIGIFEAGIMFVVYVERITLDDNDVIRIISARYAEREEKKRYVGRY